MTQPQSRTSEAATLALADWQAGRHERAIDAAEKATLSGDAAAMGLLLQFARQPQAPDSLIARARQALEDAPSGVMRNRHRAFFRVAGLGADAGDWAGALEQRLEASGGGDWVALTELGLLAVMTDDAQTGRAWLEQAGQSGSGLAIAALMRESLETGYRLACLDTLGPGFARSGHPMAGGLMKRCAQLPPAPDGSTPRSTIDAPAALARIHDVITAPPPAADNLCKTPRIDRWTRAIAPSACDYLTVGAAPLLKPAEIVNPGSGNKGHASYRNSLIAAMPDQAMDLVTWAIKTQMASLAGTTPRHGEALAVIVYRPGEEYRAHYDFILESDGHTAEDIRSRGQRVSTSLARLNEEFTGGDTVFPRLDVRWQGKRGDALSFDNVDSQGAVHKTSLHAGEPVKEGVKVLASLWLRERL